MEILKKSWKLESSKEYEPCFFFFESEYFSYLCKLFYSVCDFLSLLHKSETLTRSQHEREAEEHKELWEAEVRARTKLGSKVK